MAHAQAIAHSAQGDSLADVLERVLTVGVVIVGDIKIKLCDVELLSIQLRLLICSVEKAKELGIPWWWEQRAPTNGSLPSSPQTSQKPLPGNDFSTRTPWEEYKRFQDFQQFQEVERAFEQSHREES